jgi:hypothetical protein
MTAHIAATRMIARSAPLPAYYAYGAKGLTVCTRWRFGENGKFGFECFLADMGPKPSPHLNSRQGRTPRILQVAAQAI